MASGVHRPEQGTETTEFTFYANFSDPRGDPRGIDVVIDGQCHPMEVELGEEGNRTFTYTGVMGEVGCYAYYFMATDQSRNRWAFPQEGSFLGYVAQACDGE